MREQRSRSGDGSTSLNKKFRGGSLVLTGANSSADLRSKTWKYAFCDEVDEWPLDLEGQGDPMEMVDARQIAFHASGEFKKFEISTPRIKGASRIDASFEAGDQRYWHVPCPQCGIYQRLVFKHLRFERTWPYKAHYVCAANGCVIEHHQKRAMVQAGRWVATAPGPGRHPSFHLDAISSLLTTWDMIAEKWWAAQGDQQKLQAFFNLWLGEAFEIRGEAPEWQRLYARRCARILASRHTAGRLQSACHLAFNTRMTSGQAIALLKTMPKAGRASGAKASRGNPLALQQMNSTRQPQVGPARDKAQGHEQLAQSVLGNLASVGLIRKEVK